MTRKPGAQSSVKIQSARGEREMSKDWTNEDVWLDYEEDWENSWRRMT